MRHVCLAVSLLTTLSLALPLAAQQKPSAPHGREWQQHQSALSRAYLTADADTRGIETAAKNSNAKYLQRDVEILGKQLEAARRELSVIEPLATADQARYLTEMRSRNADAANWYDDLKGAADRGDFAFVLSHILDIRRDVTGAENTRREMMHQPPLQARPANAAEHPRPERHPVTPPVHRTAEPRVPTPPTIERKAAPNGEESRRPPVERKRPVVEHQPPIVEHAPPTAEHKAPLVERRPPATGHKPPVMEQKPSVVEHKGGIERKAPVGVERKVPATHADTASH